MKNYFVTTMTQNRLIKLSIEKKSQQTLISLTSVVREFVEAKARRVNLYPS